MKHLSKMKVIGFAALSLMLAPLGANALVDGVATASDGYTVGYMFDLGIGAGDCVADPGNCGTLMVNDKGATVQMALILPLSLKDNTYGDNSDPAYDQKFTSLTGSDKLGMEFDGQELYMDFLQGDPDKNDGPTFNSGFTGAENSPTEASKPSWAIAAATSMEYNSLLPGAADFLGDEPVATSSPGDGTGNATEQALYDAWEFQHVYEWELSSDAFANNTFSIDQVALKDIHLSPKKDDYTKNPPLVPCSPNDPNNCLPPGGCTPGDPGCGGGDVPVPGTLVLMLMGLGILRARTLAVKKAQPLPLTTRGGAGGIS